MRTQTPYEAYQHAAETSDPSVQIMMLYNAAINYVKQAQVAIEEGDFDTRHTLINKAMSVMRGLRVCLDFSACEEVASAMDKYYEALDSLMVDVQCNHDERTCSAIIENLTIIRDTWNEINSQPYESTDGTPPTNMHS